jgi:hypothetical protein
MSYAPGMNRAGSESTARIAGNMGKATLAVKSGAPSTGLRAAKLGTTMEAPSTGPKSTKNCIQELYDQKDCHSMYSK